MGIYTIDNTTTVQRLLQAVQIANDPVIVYEKEDECMVAMRPAVFERILFDGNLLNAADRDSLHL